MRIILTVAALAEIASAAVASIDHAYGLAAAWGLGAASAVGWALAETSAQAWKRAADARDDTIRSMQ